MTIAPTPSAPPPPATTTPAAAPTSAAKPTTTTTANTPDVPANATCVEFLHLMKAFSESAVNVTEMAQRVDSLVHQDEQLLRLLPLQPKALDGSSSDDQVSDGSPGGRASTSSRGSTAGSIADTTDDESSSASGRAGADYGVDVEAMAAAMDISMAEGMKKWHEEALKQGGDDDDTVGDDDDMDLDIDLDVDLEVGDDDSDEGFVSDEMEVDEDGNDSMDDDGASTDAETRSSSQPRISSLGDEEDDADDEALREQKAQEDLQRWMELELDLDSTEDPYDTSLHLPGVGSTLLSAPPVSSTVASVSGPTSVANAALGVHTTLATTAGSHANSSSVLSTTTTMTTKDRLRAALFDRKSVTAALFDDDDDEDDEDDATDLVLMNALMRKKNAAQGQSLVGTKRPLEQETKTDDDFHASTIWGMEVDSYEQDLLSSIDHSVLCDRENRFLQWDLEIEAATAAAVAAAAVSQKTELRTPPSSVSTGATAFANASAEARQKLMMASSPRDHKMTQPLRSPSNVDTNFAAEDWSSLDFGTFQNRTVSHILSSCLHKRKLHHPYKDRVTLVNFNVPGGEPIGPPPNHAMPMVTGSLLFGAGLEGADILLKNGGSGAVSGMLPSTGVDSKDMKLKSGEKKPKKPRVDGERKKKMHPFDIGAGGDDQSFAAKLAMTKLENLPLPDLTNLPQDLKELKRKIEATEHKVEGTKHRHRKGGPCPRCQVQNQLRAAKRAYHKRAVAHKKLPQLGTVSPALTATAVVVSPPPAASVSAPIATTVPSPTTTKPVVSATVASPATAKTVVSASTLAATPTVAGAPASIVRPATAPIVQQPPVAPAATSIASTTQAVALKPATVTASVVSSAVGAQATKSPALSHPITSAVVSATAPATAAVATPSPFPRRSCGENALASPFSSPSSVPSDGSTPSSPESASPAVHHVTVTSA